MTVGAVAVREYEDADEARWLRCRVLSFLRTSYFDDVQATKPRYGLPGVSLVAEVDERMVGLIDVVVYGEGLATIETIAVMPDVSRRGIGSLLLAEALAKLPEDVAVLDAWTREDAEANAWYRRNGFTQTYAYLHVFADAEELTLTLDGVRQGFTAVAGWFHADIADEKTVRSAYARVNECRRYERQVR